MALLVHAGSKVNPCKYKRVHWSWTAFLPWLRLKYEMLMRRSGNKLTVILEIEANTLRPRQNGRHFADDVFKCILLNGNVWIPIKISLKFVPKGPINNIPSLVLIMAWRRSSDKPSSEPMMVRLKTHICVTRLQWVKDNLRLDFNIVQQTPRLFAQRKAS